MGMPYYLPEEKGWKRHAEGIIPLIILLLIAVVLIGKTTSTFCSVPVLNSVLCTKTGQVMIGVIGDFNGVDTLINASKLQQVIDTQGATYQIYWQPIAGEALTWGQDQLLRSFDIVVVVGEKNLAYAQRDALGKYINGGGKVMLIGDAATLDPDDVLIKGWSSTIFGDAVPAELSIAGPISSVPTQSMTNVRLNFWNPEHPVLHDYGKQFQLNLSQVDCGSITTVKVNPSEGATVIAALSGNDSATTKQASQPGILEKSTGFGGGQVIYFNYDPGCTRSLAFATIRYMAGR